MRNSSKILALTAVLASTAIVVCAVRLVASRHHVDADSTAMNARVSRSEVDGVTEQGPHEWLDERDGTLAARENADDTKSRPNPPARDVLAAHIVPSKEAANSATLATATHPPLRIAGSIRGLLIREGGPWTTDTLPQPNTVMIDLVPDGKPSESVRARIEPRPDLSGNFTLEFEYPDLEEGNYVLTLSALGSRRWAPVSVHVTPPASGITFTRYDKDPRLPLEFHVSDAATGDKIESFQTRNLQLTPSDDNGVFLQTGPLDVNAFTVDGRFQWSLWADGYAPAFGDETAFMNTGDKRVADIRLQRGWSTKVLVLARDPVAHQVVGARVSVNGHVIGSTGIDGMLVVSAASQPTSLQVDSPGWHATSDPLQPYAGKSASQRGQITIVMLEK